MAHPLNGRWFSLPKEGHSDTGCRKDGLEDVVLGEARHSGQILCVMHLEEVPRGVRLRHRKDGRGFQGLGVIG